MKWNESAVVMEFLRTSGMVEEAPGRWVGNGRIYQLFDEGMVMTTVTLQEKPDYDIETVHTAVDGETEGELFKRALRTHTEEIRRRTQLLREGGLKAVANNRGGSN